MANYAATIKNPAIAKSIRQGKPFSLKYNSCGVGVCEAKFWVNTEESSRIQRWDGLIVPSDESKPMEINCITLKGLCSMVKGMLSDQA